MGRSSRETEGSRTFHPSLILVPFLVAGIYVLQGQWKMGTKSHVAPSPPHEAPPAHHDLMQSFPDYSVLDEDTIAETPRKLLALVIRRRVGSVFAKGPLDRHSISTISHNFHDIGYWLEFNAAIATHPSTPLSSFKAFDLSFAPRYRVASVCGLDDRGHPVIPLVTQPGPWQRVEKGGLAAAALDEARNEYMTIYILRMIEELPKKSPRHESNPVSK